MRRLQCALMLQVSLPARSDIIWIAWLSLGIPPYWKQDNCEAETNSLGLVKQTTGGAWEGGAESLLEQGSSVREILK